MSCLLCFLMPDHSRHARSSADDGLYLVPYWVQAGRLWCVILVVLFCGGVILPFSAAWFGRRTFSNGFGYGAAATFCSLVRDDKVLSPDAAVEQLQALKTSFSRTGAIDARHFQSGVSEVVDSLGECAFLSRG